MLDRSILELNLPRAIMAAAGQRRELAVADARAAPLRTGSRRACASFRDPCRSTRAHGTLRGPALDSQTSHRHRLAPEPDEQSGCSANASFRLRPPRRHVGPGHGTAVLQRHQLAAKAKRRR
jgi:hypothetical protein